MTRPLNILIVDDHHGFRALIRELLGSCAAVLQFGEPRFSECASAEEALQVVTTERPDLVTMDLHLQGMDGTECIRRLRPVLPNAVMIVVTQLRDISVSQHSLKAGADTVIFKDDLTAMPLMMNACLAAGLRT